MNADLPTYAATNGTKMVNHPVVCYRSILVASAGVWLGDNPLAFALPLLLAQMTLIFAVSNLFHFVLKRLGQPTAVSHIVAGVFLGLSVLGRDKTYVRTLFPARSRIHLDILSEMGLMVFLFMIGVKTDLGMIKKSGKKAMALGLTSTLVPMGLMSVAGYLLRDSLPRDFVDGQFIYKLATTWSRTSYAVLACVLTELKLLNSKVGRLAMSSTLVADFFGTVVNAVYTAVQLVMTARNRMMGVGSFLSFLALLAFIVGVARPVALWMIRRTPEGGHLDDTYFGVIMVLVYTCGLAGELIGHHATTGTFLLGLALPGGAPLGMTLEDRFDTMLSGIVMPVLLGSAGYRCNFFAFADGARCGYLLLLLCLGVVGKVVGVALPCWFCRVPLPDMVALNLMLVSKGFFEVYMLNIWLDASVVDEQMYAVVVLCIVGFTAITTPFLKFTYKPSSYVAYKRRTLQHAKPGTEPRLMICVHGQHHVGPILAIIKAFQPTKEQPICLHILHLVQLAGHAAATLAPYKPKSPTSSSSSSDHATETDHIMNAFRAFEQNNVGAVVLQPFYAMSPQATMHDDVCTLALDKKVCMIFLPFHKHHAIDGSLEADRAIRNMNLNVFDYAPCSVSVYIDHGNDGGSHFAPSSSQMQHIGVYYLGGPDDRECLTYAATLAERGPFALTVIRLRPPREWREGDPEEAADDEYVDQFRARLVDDERVVYREEDIRDGEGTVGVIRATSHYFSLLLVGRRKGVESPLTEGLSMWSEYPELGIVGDVLACTDFGGNVSTLVVQQQTRVGSGDRGDSISCNPAALRSRCGFTCRRISPQGVEGAV